MSDDRYRNRSIRKKSTVRVPREIDLDPNAVTDRFSGEALENLNAMWIEVWKEQKERIYSINQQKGWIRKGRNSAELIALIHSELSECLESLRRGNPPSKKCPDITHAEEELADVIIRIMDLEKSQKKWNIAKAVAIKIEYNKTRPYRHGGKRF